MSTDHSGTGDVQSVVVLFTSACYNPLAQFFLLIFFSFFGGIVESVEDQTRIAQERDMRVLRPLNAQDVVLARNVLNYLDLCGECSVLENVCRD